MAQPLIINIGNKYGMLTVLKDEGSISYNNGAKRRIFKCVCECGNEIIVRLDSIISGHTHSCGCHKIKVISNLKAGLKHGLISHPLYMVWTNMKRRCYKVTNKAYCYYGARGIVVCDEWKDDFECFYNWSINNGWLKGLELDRRENDGNYEPSNCRYVPKLINFYNRRKNVIKPIFSIENDYDKRLKQKIKY